MLFIDLSTKDFKFGNYYYGKCEKCDYELKTTDISKFDLVMIKFGNKSKVVCKYCLRQIIDNVEGLNEKEIEKEL